MTFSAILCMHGYLSEYLLNTSEIILGKQKDVEYINFLSNDSIEKLNDCYLNSLSKLDLDNKYGIICMVDIWGGSTFNVGCKILKNLKYNYSIISGVNIPMLIDFFMIRNKKKDISEITESILLSGKTGINNIIKKNK